MENISKIPDKFKSLIDKEYLKVGKDVYIHKTVTFINLSHPDNIVEIGDGCIIRSGCVIYGGCSFANNVKVGHNTILMSKIIVGENSYIGGLCNFEGDTRIGSNCGINAQCHITKFTVIGDYTFFGPMVCTTNDYKMRYKRSGHGEALIGPIIGRGVRVGNMATILPGIVIGDNSIIGAASIITKNVPKNSIVFGSPAEIKGEVPEDDRL
uniref:Putative hexapeptide repeat-containing transferase n=1 Tax=viral metagenome TaxID=1070528 RepID=A0A6M3KJU2_9ZZZZ